MRSPFLGLSLPEGARPARTVPVTRSRPRGTRGWYNGPVAEYLNQLLADPAMALVRESFTGVRATWWWERRVGGGIEVCQELDPRAMAREVSSKTGAELGDVRRAIADELGLEDDEPVVLTFEIPGDATTHEASRVLAERSSQPEGLAAGPYRQVEERFSS